MSHKFCSKCGEEKPYERFDVSKANIDGCQAWCKDCKSREPRAPLEPVDEPDEKLCPRCDTVKPINDFPLKKKKKEEYGRQAWCRRCFVDYSRAQRRFQDDERWAIVQREQNKRDLYEIENARKRAELDKTKPN